MGKAASCKQSALALPWPKDDSTCCSSQPVISDSGSYVPKRYLSLAFAELQSCFLRPIYFNPRGLLKKKESAFRRDILSRGSPLHAMEESLYS